MLRNVLREDALTSGPEGYELRIGLPWIRSMPLSCILGLSVTVDGWSPGAASLRVRLGNRTLPIEELVDEPGWWFIQDRLVLAFPGGGFSRVDDVHEVAVDLELMIPYLSGGGAGPLVLPFHLEASLRTSQEVLGGVSRDVA